MPKNRGWGMFRRGRRPCQSANASSRKTEAGGFEGEDRWRNIAITLIDPRSASPPILNERYGLLATAICVRLSMRVGKPRRKILHLDSPSLERDTCRAPATRPRAAQSRKAGPNPVVCGEDATPCNLH